MKGGVKLTLFVLLLLIGAATISLKISEKNEINFSPGKGSAGKISSDGGLSSEEEIFSNKIVGGKGLETNRIGSRSGEDVRIDKEVPKGEELLVKFKQGVNEVEINSILSQEDLTQVDIIEQIDVRIIKINSEVLDINARRDLTNAKVNSLSNNADVKFVEKNERVWPVIVPNDEFLGFQWHLNVMGLIQAWDFEIGNSEVLIATGDSGINTSHEDIAGRYIAGWNYDADNDDIEGVNFHGTSTFGVLGAVTNNSVGVAGTTWSNPILVDKIGSDGDGSSTYSIIAASITNASDLGARVYSLSYAPTWDSSTVIEAAGYFRTNGGLVFAGAGNEAEFYNVEDIPEVIYVGATDLIDDLAPYSNTGPFVDLVAPGGNLAADLNGDGFGDGILTTDIGGEYSFNAGTSISTPIAAGIAALVFSVNLDFTPEEVEQILEETAVDLGNPGFDNDFGWGRIDASAAIEMAVNIVGCVDECTTPGNVCFGDSEVFECGQLDEDICLDFDIIQCGAGETCHEGECVAQCEEVFNCETLGFECGDHLICGEVVDCGPCDEGQCDACAEEDLVRCTLDPDALNTFEICSVDETCIGGLSWGEPTACPLGAPGQAPILCLVQNQNGVECLPGQWPNCLCDFCINCGGTCGDQCGVGCSGTECSGDDTCSNGQCIPPVTSTCEDFDSEVVGEPTPESLLISSYVEITTGQGEVITSFDECVFEGSPTVVERWCLVNGDASGSRSCPDSHPICSNGRCVAEDVCFDSDNSDNPPSANDPSLFSNGYTQFGNGGQVWDRCNSANPDSVVERYCDGINQESISLNCGEGNTCVEDEFGRGKCIVGDEICVDSDNSSNPPHTNDPSINLIGFIQVGSSAPVWDRCSNNGNGNVVEYYCDGFSGEGVQVNCREGRSCVEDSDGHGRCVSECPADFNGDGSVGAADLAALLGNWGSCEDPSNCPWDLDRDRLVGASDLAALLGNWGSCG